MDFVLKLKKKKSILQINGNLVAVDKLYQSDLSLRGEAEAGKIEKRKCSQTWRPT
jgi:hypothetical protein